MLKILDTSTVIVVLDFIHCPEIFDYCIEKGHELCVTHPVYEEIQSNPTTFKLFNEYGKISIRNSECQYSGETYEYLKKRHISLHEGEISVLCEAKSLSDNDKPHYCIVDDLVARKRGDELNIQLTGTIGLLLWGKKNGCLEEEDCLHIYEKIKNSSFRIDDQILRMLIS